MVDPTIDIARQIGSAIRLGDRGEVRGEDMRDDLFHGTANLNGGNHRLVIVPVIFEVFHAGQER